MSYEEQIMSKDKYPSILLSQMETIVFIVLQIFFATRSVLKIGEYINNSRHLVRKYGYLSADIICSDPRSEQFSESVARGKL